MILLLAGTKDGRRLAAAIVKAGFRVMASAATPYGGELLREISGVLVHTGRLDAAGLERLAAKHKVKGILDATHPFAVEITRISQEVASSLELPYLCWERQPVKLPDSKLLHRVKTWDGAAVKIKELDARIVFLAVGVNPLPFIVGHPLLSCCRFVARVLPLAGSVSNCLRNGLKPGQIVALQGPGSRELNSALFEHFQAEALVIKESGPEGGTPEKAAAALELGIPVVLVERPTAGADVPTASNIEKVIHWVEQVEGRSRASM